VQLELENAERNRSAHALPKESKVGKIVLRMSATSFVQQSDATSAMVAENHAALRAQRWLYPADPLPPILFNPGMFRRPLLWETSFSPEDVFHFREAAPTGSYAIAAEAPEIASRILSKLSLLGPITLCYGKRFAFNAADQRGAKRAWVEVPSRLRA
jgi:hypothetical protein